MNEPDNICWSGQFLRIVKRGRWEITQRHNCNGVVGIIPITDQGEVVLVEQYRIPVEANVIELAAGLSGDSAEYENEPLQQAAERELLEETGYAATDWEVVGKGASSAGLTDEITTFFFARGLQKINGGGGVASESITVHCVKIDELEDWLAKQEAAGKILDAKIYAAMYWIFKYCR